MNISHLISLITFPCDRHGVLAVFLREDVQETRSEGLSLQAQCQRSSFLPLRWLSIMDSDRGGAGRRALPGTSQSRALYPGS